MIIHLVPYLHFDGTCEQAFRFYESQLGGSFRVIHRYDHPGVNLPGINKFKVLHAEYQLTNSIMIYGCDFYPNRSVVKGNAEPAISLAFDSETDALEKFRKLTAGGAVLLPFAKQFWGAMHGQLIDQFGVKWMFNK